MDVSVYTYHHPKKWREQKELYNLIKKEIHITATKNLAEGIKDFYQDPENGEFQYIFTFRQVINRILRKWNSAEMQLNQYLSLSKVISGISGSQHLKDSFRSNTAELLETIRSLVFSKLEPRHLARCPKLTPKEAYFHQIWASLETEDPSYDDLRKVLNLCWKRDRVIKVINQLLNSQLQVDSNIQIPEIDLTSTKLVLHGFYFITPEQQIVIKKLQEAGFELIFMNFYDNRFPDTFDFTKAFISKRFGWTDNWYIEPNNDESVTVGTILLNAFEEGKGNKLTLPPQIIAYDWFFDFLHRKIMMHYPIGEKTVFSKSKEYQFIATNADILNEILVQYYPENFAEKRNFLNYPVGRFILKIHEMLQGGQLVINEEILMSTFSSGWLYDEVSRRNARDYSYELKQLLPFFVNCTTTEEWLNRFQTLIEQYEQILPLFNNDGDNRIIESIRSPFAKIAYLSFDVNTIKQIRSFVLLLEDMASKLFVLSSDVISVNEHFTRLAELMRKHNPINHTVLKEEEELLIEKLSYKISQIEDDHTFLYEDIGQAISFYLSGKFDDEEDFFIKPFIEVDGEAFKKNVKKFYLTGLDEQGLPLSEFSTPWPLQDETFAILSENHRVLELYELRNRSIKQISRYLLFIALEFLPKEQLELSWIRNFLDRVDLQPAVYVHQLNLRVVNPPSESHESEKKGRNPFDFATYSLDKEGLNSALEELKYEDILAEFELCQRRFYYGYVLGRYPVFSEEFIHQFIFTEIVKLVKRYTQKPNDEVIKLVSELFPQWTEFKKNALAQTSIGYAGHRQEKQDAIDENVSVSETRKNFQFPGLTNDNRNKLFEEVMIKKEEIMKILQNPLEEKLSVLVANPGYNCRFCPHLDYCSEGVNAVDEVRRK